MSERLTLSRATLAFCLWLFGATAFAGEAARFGPLFDQFDLTLAPGHRTEALGPMFYDETKETQRTWAIPPLFSRTIDPETESEEYDVLYPLLSYDRFGDQYRWHLGQLLSFAGGPTQQESERRRFTLFPVYFQQRSSDPAENYTAVFPFYGHMKNHLFRDEISFVMFPIYGQSRKKDVITDNYVYPVFHLRHGNGLTGWQFWPLVGRERKVVTTETNNFGDTRTIGGHDRLFVLWPFFFRLLSGLGTDDAGRQQGVIPFYVVQRSAKRDSTTVVWPFFSKIEDREKKYHEWDAPWPLIVFADGPGKTTRRVWPFFSQAQSSNLVSEWYLWPVYKVNRIKADPLDRRRTRILFFLYSDTEEKNLETGAAYRRRDLWPLYSHRRDLDGNARLQILALLEPYLPNSKSIERNYSPLWALWRAEHNPGTGAGSQSLLWNLYRRDTTPKSSKVSFLFGLYQRQSGPGGRATRLFYIPLSRAGPAQAPSPPAAAGPSARPISN